MPDFDRRGLYVVAMALVISLSAIGYAGYVGDQARRASGPRVTVATLVSPSPTTDATASPAASAPLSPSATPATSTKTIAFLGDGWTLGAGTTCGPGCAFAELAAGQLGMKANVDAVAGTGYSNGGGATIPGPDTFAARLAHFESFKADIMIVAGGQNDASFVQANVQRSANGLLARLHQDLPQASVVVIGPFSTSGQASSSLLATRDVIAAAARANGVTFIDPIAEQWITGVQSQPASGNAAQYIGSNGADPTVDGYKYLADRLVADLKQLKLV